MSSRPPRSNKAEAAQKAGRFKDEIVPVEIAGKKGTVRFEVDEYIRHGRYRRGSMAELQARLQQGRHGDGRQRFGPERWRGGGRHDVGAARARELGLKPLARIKAYSSAGVDPKIMGMGPVPRQPAVPEEGGLERTPTST